MPHAKPRLGVGDWVRSSYPGFWRVHRVVTYRDFDPFTGRERMETAAFGRRFVNDSFKPAFDRRRFDPRELAALSRKDAAKLNAFIAAQPGAFARFEAYQPPDVDAIFNASVQAARGLAKRKLQARMPKNRWVGGKEIDPLLTRLGFDIEGFPRLTVQFVSPKHRIESGRLVYKFHRVL
jgi:hypothetical protein